MEKTEKERFMYFLIHDDESRVVKIAETLRELKEGIPEEEWPGYLGDSLVFKGKVDSKGRLLIPLKKVMHCTHVYELLNFYPPLKRGT